MAEKLVAMKVAATVYWRAEPSVDMMVVYWADRMVHKKVGKSVV